MERGSGIQSRLGLHLLQATNIGAEAYIKTYEPLVPWRGVRETPALVEMKRVLESSEFLV